MSGPGNAPVIIKRKKVVVGGGHHGGAWKVAYADFVTAMMAFFLLMWLLGATNEKQRKGIADFFNPTIPVNKVSGGGDGAFGGDSVFTEQSLARTGTGAVAQSADQSRGAVAPDQDPSSHERAEERANAVLADAQQKLSGIGGESMVSELLQRHVTSRITDEGLVVELADAESAPLFRDISVPTQVLSELLEAVVEVFDTVPNGIAIQAHVAATPVVARDRPGWETSAARARSVREAMQIEGIAETRFDRITGFSDRRPVSSNPLSGRNNRIEIILLRTRV